MAETLFSGSQVWLFGRKMSDITVAGADKPALARIYAFGFEGQVIPLARPAIFRVLGDPIDPADPAKLGLATSGYQLPGDMVAWSVNREDMTLRLDEMTGTVDRLLIDYELGGEGIKDYVRGGRDVGRPSPIAPASRGVRARRWRSDDE
ncbi:MAG: hypothetical protein DI556_18525 [Rhodovulum sulfidophilum]|uniref:Uncharacterized protein n=1 Tax=Rhodovulum sulfidophilum TaxID=35806 RepID=A0A2W5N1N8_RHOSU|nr:MAG: hypothetical protein DI556_18525 [Rhodovulum sulfidophilum]